MCTTTTTTTTTHLLHLSFSPSRCYGYIESVRSFASLLRYLLLLLLLMHYDDDDDDDNEFYWGRCYCMLKRELRDDDEARRFSNKSRKRSVNLILWSSMIIVVGLFCCYCLAPCL